MCAHAHAIFCGMGVNPPRPPLGAKSQRGSQPPSGRKPDAIQPGKLYARAGRGSTGPPCAFWPAPVPPVPGVGEGAVRIRGIFLHMAVLAFAAGL